MDKVKGQLVKVGAKGSAGVARIEPHLYSDQTKFEDNQGWLDVARFLDVCNTHIEILNITNVTLYL